MFWCPRGFTLDPLCMLISLAARDNKFDVVLVDTAGRMQDNEPLMRALAKVSENCIRRLYCAVHKLRTPPGMTGWGGGCGVEEPVCHKFFWKFQLFFWKSKILLILQSIQANVLKKISFLLEKKNPGTVQIITQFFLHRSRFFTNNFFLKISIFLPWNFFDFLPQNSRTDARVKSYHAGFWPWRGWGKNYDHLKFFLFFH